MNVISQKQQCWNERLRKCMYDRGYTQTSFADALNQKYGTQFTQKTISRWVTLGGAAKDAIKDFPEFKNMLYAAELLQVDIGYLLGETDADSFSYEKASDFTGLSQEAIKTLRHMTSPQSRFYFGYESETFRRILSTFISNDRFIALIEALHTLDEQTCALKNLDKKLTDAFSEALLHEAFKIHTGSADYEHDGSLPALSSELVTAINMIDKTIDEQDKLNYSIKVARYELNETFIILINEIYNFEHTSITQI